MHILFVVPYVPSLVRVRPYNIIRALAARGHQITLVTLWTNEQEQAELEHLRPFTHEIRAVDMPRTQSLWNCVQALPGRQPLQSVFSWKPDLLEPFQNGRLSEFDVVHVEHLRGSRYGLQLKATNKIPVIWDSVDCITHLFRQAADQSTDWMRRWRSSLDLSRTEWYEGWLITQFDHVIVTSPTDKAALRALSEKEAQVAPITVLPNGVALDYFKPDTAVVRESATLIVSGKMSYHANISMVNHLVEDIMPHVWDNRPDVKLMIVGKDPTREIKALVQNPNIIVTGTVDELPPYLQRATVSVAPITYNAGIQNKVLEAMACGTPVVTTPQAVASLAVEGNKDLLVAAKPELFARQILSLLASPERQQQVGAAGRSYVEEHHNWENMAARLENIYEKSIQKQRQPSLKA